MPNNNVDGQFLQWFATLGVGGVLAGFMFVFYRKDTKSYTDLWKSQADRMDALVNVVLQVVKENTESNSKLIALIENMQRNSLRKEDIESLIDRRIGDRK